MRIAILGAARSGGQTIDGDGRALIPLDLTGLGRIAPPFGFGYVVMSDAGLPLAVSVLAPLVPEGPR